MTWLTVGGAAVLFGPTLLATLLPEVQHALVSHGVLVDHDVLVPIGTGTGLDMARVVLVAGAITLLVLLTIATIRHRAARAAGSEARGRS
ncbi:hypothetical protein [Clavibacter nebraskensis]|uniref:hypothetical protein n=1 Tax=Clavibacter nebraskensis TaxID=31963 RepID=UPI003F4B4F5E